MPSLRDDETPLVTVTIPAHNAGSYLPAALASLVAQTEERWHAIVVDDGSDEDIAWAESLDPRIRLVRQVHMGVSAARNTAMRLSCSEFVAFLDADDVWHPTKLTTQIAAMRAKPQAGLCSTAFEIIDESGKRIGDGYEGYAKSYRELLEGNGIATSTVMLRRGVLDAVGDFNERYTVAQDWDLWLRIARQWPIIRVAAVLAAYRVHTFNASANYRHMLNDSRVILRGHEIAATAEGRADNRGSARTGTARVRRLAGVQAFDAFRESRRMGDMRFALRNAPRYTIGSVIRWALRARPRTNE